MSHAHTHRDGDLTGSEPPQGYDSGEEGFSLRNYWMMLLERKWYAITVFLLAVLASIIVTVMATPIYSSFSLVQVLKRSSQVLQVIDVVESTIANDTDFNTQTKLIESVALAQAVAERLTPEEIVLLTEPYQTGGTETTSPVSVIMKNRSVRPQRLTLMVAIEVRHPSPRIAARVANLYAEEYIAYNSRLRVEESLKIVDELKDRADQQRKRVEDLANALHAFRQRENLISLVQTKDIVTERLKALNLMATHADSRLKDAEIRWKQVQEASSAGGDLTTLSFIAMIPAVSSAVQQTTAQRLLVAQLSERYKEKHPRMVEAKNTLGQAENELTNALRIASANIKTEYENAFRANEEARKALSTQEALSLDMDKQSVQHDNLVRELRINEQLLESMLSRMRETSITSTIETHGARVVDRAFEPIKPVSPKPVINIAVGVVGGLVLGVGAAFLVSMFDDKIKSVFDVESLMGLPLLSVVGRIKNMDLPDKAQIVSNGAHPEISEAFLTLYTSIRMTEVGRNAKIFMVTSTMPGEGKSFVTANLAQVFASQGCRTILVDCDLRKPSVHAIFNLPAGSGLIQYCNSMADVARAKGSSRAGESIIREIHPNLDIMITGGRAKNPIRLLNSSEFDQFVQDLSKEYDAIFLDTPPLGVVSDALNVASLADGIIYVVEHGKVPRKFASQTSRRLTSTNVHVLGAVLNGVDSASARYAYGDYTDSTFKEYTRPQGATS
ncbi:MAG: polysaccharide biosynthesis tyrosine autokinase [Opitutaceae bacterium]|nr:polysaccharide biosynthesis tyrosine autokinase [Opitutaceae bacterium]